MVVILFCHGVKLIFQFHERDFVLRSPKEHNKMCDVIEKADNPAYHSTTYGINRRSSLNDLTFYDICDYGLPPDIMHDLLEGYVPYKMKLMLKHFICEEKRFTLDELNSRIRMTDIIGYVLLL